MFVFFVAIIVIIALPTYLILQVRFKLYIDR